MLSRIFGSWPCTPIAAAAIGQTGGRRGGGLPELSRAGASVSVPSDSGTIDFRSLPVQLVVSTGCCRPQPSAERLIFGLNFALLVVVHVPWSSGSSVTNSKKYELQHRVPCCYAFRFIENEKIPEPSPAPARTGFFFYFLKQSTHRPLQPAVPKAVYSIRTCCWWTRPSSEIERSTDH